LEFVTATIEKLQKIKAFIEAAHDRIKGEDPIEFNVGDKVMLKVSPWKGIIRFRKRGKLSLRFIGPFKIIARVGTTAYRSDLPDKVFSGPGGACASK
jgi:hypothetical protein